MATLPERLRQAREQAGLSQGQVARMLDMSRPTVSEIEAGNRRLRADEVPAFARLYDVSVTWLWEGKEEVDRSDVQLAARELASLRPQDVEKVMDLLRTMKARR